MRSKIMIVSLIFVLMQFCSIDAICHPRQFELGHNSFLSNWCSQLHYSVFSGRGQRLGAVAVADEGNLVAFQDDKRLVNHSVSKLPISRQRPNG